MWHIPQLPWILIRTKKNITGIKEMRITPTVIIICGIFLCSTWTCRGVNAATTSEYIRNLQPQAVGTRGVGGKVPAPVMQKSPEVAVRLRFGLNSATLRPDAVEELNRLAKALENESLRDYKYIIEGHTCDRGAADHNMNLSMRRAYAVADFLTTNSNLSPDQFDVKWFGESRPAEPNTDENARKRNRRVVIRNTLETADVLLNGRPAALQINFFQNGQEAIVADGDTLQSGDHYSIIFKTTAEPYAYVCQIDSSGQAELLFPNSTTDQQSNPVTPGSTYRIPGTDELFFLDEVTGTEQFILITHKTPLQDPILACKTAATGDAVGKRGVGGVTSLHNGERADSIEDNMQLCEVMPGGKTRGVGGIVQVDSDPGPGNDNAALPDNSCQGFFLKRYFFHK